MLVNAHDGLPCNGASWREPKCPPQQSGRISWGVLGSSEQGQTSALCDNMKTSHKPNVQRKKPDTKEHSLCESM